jgi:hypothetical protein
LRILSKITKIKPGSLKNIDEENERIKNEIENAKKSLRTLDEDIDREKSIIIDAKSNEKRLKEEKNDLIEIDSKYYQTEKNSNEDLEHAKNKLQNEQTKVEEILGSFSSINLKNNLTSLNEIKNNVNKAKDLIKSEQYEKASQILDECNINISVVIQNINENEDNEKILKISSKNKIIKEYQEDYANFYSKNENIKNESLKRSERIKTIDTEIQSWKNLLINSEKMIVQLNNRKNNVDQKLDELEKEPQSQAEKKGQTSESLRLSGEEKEQSEKIIYDLDQKVKSKKDELNNLKKNR